MSVYPYGTTRLQLDGILWNFVFENFSKLCIFLWCYIKDRVYVIYHSCDKGSCRQSLLSTARCCNVCGRNLIKRLTSAASPRVDISSTCKAGQKLGVSVPMLTCSLSAWQSRLLYRRGRKSRGDLWITLYIILFYILHSPAKGRIYLEANEPFVSGPHSCRDPFQGPGKGPSNVFIWSYIFEKIAKIRYFNHNLLNIIEVYQEVNL